MDTTKIGRRRLRQADELCGLCRHGMVSRAIDLAFEHFAEFGRDPEVITVLGQSIDGPGVPDRVRQRFAELIATSH